MSEVTKELTAVPRGQWKLVRVDGVIEVRVGKPTPAEVLNAIGATALDTVNLRGPGGALTGVVMFVDDNGLAKGLQRNVVATAIYHAQCKPGTTHPICGDVGFVNDDDF